MPINAPASAVLVHGSKDSDHSSVPSSAEQPSGRTSDMQALAGCLTFFPALTHTVLGLQPLNHSLKVRK